MSETTRTSRQPRPVRIIVKFSVLVAGLAGGYIAGLALGWWS